MAETPPVGGAGGARGTASDSICTIVAKNYVAQARVLAESVRQHAPMARFSTLVIDGAEADRSQPGLGQVLLPQDLGLDTRELHAMQLTYDVMEYATALKPAALMHLLRSGSRTATYLDPDIRLFAPIDDVFDTAATAGIAITPHTLEPMPRDSRMLNESIIMHAGMYNLGFIATGGSAYRFLAWWHDRLRTDAIVDIHNALFTDQRWIDWAPALAQPAILRDKGLNAAYWNLHERTIARTPDGVWTAGGVPLRFFHFSGYDPAKPWVLSKHQGANPRGLLSENESLRELCRDYGAALVDSGHIELRRERYGHDVLPSGLHLTHIVRRLCRDAILESDPALCEPPDPWQDEQAFRTWLLADDLGSGTTTFSRLDYALWRARVDLQAAFPDPLVAGARTFRAWLDTADDAAAHRASVCPAPAQPLPAPRQRAARRQHSLGGWSIVSYARAELGVGEAGRRLASAVALSGVPWEMVGLTGGSLSRQNHSYRGALATHPGYDNQILCVNADQTPRIATALGPRHPDGRRIGYWFWELEDLPEHLHEAFHHVDEVWVSSEFNRRSIAAVTDKPVTVVPPPVRLTPPSPRFTREQLGVPTDRTAFLVNFDYLSVLARKNPLGAIEAYRRAFDPGDGAVLIVKSINGHLRLLDREHVRIAATGRPDILLWEDYFSAQELRSLAEVVDCVVSLHRSEGFGLNLVDAMVHGTPVIATAYSGNMQFMDDSSAFLVPFELTEVGPGSEPYSPTAVWAEPDLDVAATHMRTVADDPATTAAVVRAARQRLLSLDPWHVGAQVRSLLVPDPNPSSIAEHRR